MCEGTMRKQGDREATIEQVCMSRSQLGTPVYTWKAKLALKKLDPDYCAMKNGGNLEIFA